MATYALIHGGAHDGHCWHLLAQELESRGHTVVAPDLPVDDESAGLDAHAQVVIDAIGDRKEVVVVAHSLGGLVGPLVCCRRPTELLVLLAALVPAPGETCIEAWERTGFELDIEGVNAPDAAIPAGNGPDRNVTALATFYHDVPRPIALDAVAHLRTQSLAVLSEPSPMAAWPEVPTSYILCRDDRMMPNEWSRRVVRESLGIEPEEIDGSHSPFLSRPSELADLLESLRLRARGQSEG